MQDASIVRPALPGRDVPLIRCRGTQHFACGSAYFSQLGVTATYGRTAAGRLTGDTLLTPAGEDGRPFEGYFELFGDEGRDGLIGTLAHFGFGIDDGDLSRGLDNDVGRDAEGIREPARACEGRQAVKRQVGGVEFGDSGFRVIVCRDAQYQRGGGKPRMFEEIAAGYFIIRHG